MLKISNNVTIPEAEIDWQAIRAQGAGGQNVNKVASAIHLRFDIAASSLPEFYKERLLALSDRRINSDGVVVIKAQRFRTQEKNLDDALQRLLHTGEPWQVVAIVGGGWDWSRPAPLRTIRRALRFAVCPRRVSLRQHCIRSAGMFHESWAR